MKYDEAPFNASIHRAYFSLFLPFDDDLLMIGISEKPVFIKIILSGT